MKAVTDTKYYDEIAYTIGIYGSGNQLKPSQMAGAIDGIVHDAEQRCERNGYQYGYAQGEAQGLIDGNAQGRQALEDEILGGAW